MKILVIDGTGRDSEHSRTKYLATEYLQKAKIIDYQLLDLYSIPLPFVDQEIMTGWLKGNESLANNYLRQFQNADMYIFVNPTWNWGAPAIIRAYLDLIVISGITFKYNKLGFKQGCLTDKQAVLISTTGGRTYPRVIASLLKAQSSDNYMVQILKTLGINQIKRVHIDRTAYRFIGNNGKFDWNLYREYVEKYLSKNVN